VAGSPGWSEAESGVRDLFKDHESRRDGTFRRIFAQQNPPMFNYAGERYSLETENGADHQESTIK
jgi:hypothetical protein